MNTSILTPLKTSNGNNSLLCKILTMRFLAFAIILAFSFFHPIKSFAGGNDPVIYLKGDTGLVDTMKIEQGRDFVEPGDSAWSPIYGDLTFHIKVTSKMVGGTSSFSHLVLGTYVFSYDVMDPAGNKAATKYRVVRVMHDTTPPVLKVNLGQNGTDTIYQEVTITPKNTNPFLTSYMVSSIDLVDGNLSGSVVMDFSLVQTTVVGIYPITYSSTDLSGNKSTVLRYVDVIDTIKPTITLNGANPDTIQLYSVFTDPGVKLRVANNYLTAAQLSHFLKVTSTVDDSVLGVYTVTYSLIDTFGNVADPVTRIVVVANSTGPISISLNGPTSVNVCQYSTYKDAGYTIHPSSASVTVTARGTFVSAGTSTAQLATLYYEANYSGGTAISATRYIYVLPSGAYSCPGTLDSIDTLICKGSCPVLTAPRSGDSYRWSTGATTRSITECLSSDTVIAVSVVKDSVLHSYVYHITVTKTSCVWPGDANYDGVADKNDILAIGVAYGDSGAKRAGASLSWSGQPCDDWSSSFRSGANYKNADCNGDGKVDSMDMSAVSKNYGYKHYKTNAVNGGPSDPPLSIAFSRDSASAGDTVSATISLGSSSIPVKNAYGLTFSIPYNFFYVKPGKATVNLNNCWLGTAGKDLIYFLHDDTANNVIDFAVTRTDHKNISSGYGEIGVLSVVMQDNLGGKNTVKRKVVLTPSDVNLISFDETQMPLYATGDSTTVTGPLAGIYNASNISSRIKLYPNPASQNIFIDAGDQQVSGIQIIDELGKQVFVQTSPSKGIIELPLTSLNSGIYTVIMTTKNGIVAKQILKN